MLPLRHTNVSTNLPHEFTPILPAAGQASFPVKRSRTFPFARGPQEEHHGHHHGAGKVPLDLDEAAYGAKCGASRFGAWAQRGILGVGIFYAFDGSSHALHDLIDWPSKRRAVETTRTLLRNPLRFCRNTSTVQQDDAARNQLTLQRVASRHQFDTYVGGVLAAASFVGCLFMGLGLAFDDQMIGFLFQSVVAHTETCMGVAVPMMVIYALGVAVTAGRNWVGNYGRGERLAQRGQQLPIPTAPDDIAISEREAFAVAERCLSSRQKLSGLATVAGIAMGVGIGLIGTVGLIGLVPMLPGALSLPIIMAQRHKPSVDQAHIAQGINQGSVADIANELVHLDEQAGLIERNIRPAGVREYSYSRFLMHRFDEPKETARRYIHDRLQLTDRYLQRVVGGEQNQDNLRRVHTALYIEPPADASERVKNQYICRQILNMLVEDKHFDAFALEMANELSAANPALTRIEMTRADLAAMTRGSVAHVSDAAIAHHAEQFSRIFLSVMHTAGYNALREQREGALDMWLATVD